MPPWEKYQSVQSDGPWSKYTEATAVADSPTVSPELQAKMYLAGAKPAQSLPQYAGQFLKEAALPVAGSLAGGKFAGVPGMALGGMLGETVSQAMGLDNQKSVFPELNKPDLTKIAVTGAANLVVPALAKTYQVAKGLVQPFYRKGQEAIIGRTLQQASGGRAGEVAKALAQSRQLVPGSQPTVGQASGNAGIASLENAANAISPEATVAMQGRIAAQNAARMRALQAIGGTDDAMATAIAARKALSESLYQKAFSSTVSPDATLQEMLTKPSVKKAMGRAAELAKEFGDDFAIGVNAPATTRGTGILNVQGQEIAKDIPAQVQSYPVKSLHYIKMALDDMQKNPERFGIGATEANAIGKTKGAFVEWLEQKVPDYGVARLGHRLASQPINQMELASVLEKKGTDAFGTTLQPNAFARALSDKTAQQVTGFDKATLETTMTPQQLATLNAIRDDLARSVANTSGAKTIGSDTIKKLAYSNLIDRAGVPTFLREFAPTQVAGNILARGADSVYGHANKEIAGLLAETLLNPKEAARMMRGANAARFQPIIDAMVRQASAGGGYIAAHQLGGQP